MTQSTTLRIARLYESWIGYDPIAEGIHPLETLETLRGYRDDVFPKGENT